MTNNILNISLFGQTGTGFIVGSDSPIFTTQIDVANIRISGNTISSIDTNGHIIFDPNGSGAIMLDSAIVTVEDDIQHKGDSDNKITFGTDTQRFDTGGTSRLDLSDSGVRLGGANARVTTILDEDDLVSDSPTALATQQSIKAYVDGTSATETEGYFNGLILEQPTATVASDGVTITLSLEDSGGGDLTLIYSTGTYAFDSTPAATVALTAGLDTAGQLNYVYIPISTKTLTASASAWPSEEYVAIAIVLCQTAASAATDGVFKMHAWTDHIVNSIDTGHSAHINFWIRQQSATWQSGVALTPTVGVTTFDIATTSGEILQLHPHAYPAYDTSAASHVYIPNDSGTAFDRVTDLTTLTTDASGGTMLNKRFNLVVWGSVSEDAGDSQLFINLPTDTYTADAAAIEDSNSTSVFTIPSTFNGTGFLISRLTIRQAPSGGGTWSLLNQEDLRGLSPATATGSGVGGITAVQDDPAPILGGNLDGGTFTITNVSEFSGDLLNIDNIRIDGNSIISTDSGGNIVVTPDTTGDLVLDGVNWPQAGGAIGTVLSISSAGQSAWTTPSGGGITWNEITGTSSGMLVANGYIANNVALVTLTLPATASVGDSIQVQGKGAGLFSIAQNASQVIHFGNQDTTTGVGGSITAQNRYDSLELLCITANTDWAVLTGSQGIFTVT